MFGDTVLTWHDGIKILVDQDPKRDVQEQDGPSEWHIQPVKVDDVELQIQWAVVEC